MAGPLKKDLFCGFPHAYSGIQVFARERESEITESWICVPRSQTSKVHRTALELKIWSEVIYTKFSFFRFFKQKTKIKMLFVNNIKHLMHFPRVYLSNSIKTAHKSEPPLGALWFRVLPYETRTLHLCSLLLCGPVCYRENFCFIFKLILSLNYTKSNQAQHLKGEFIKTYFLIFASPNVRYNKDLKLLLFVAPRPELRTLVFIWFQNLEIETLNYAND